MGSRGRIRTQIRLTYNAESLGTLPLHPTMEHMAALEAQHMMCL